MSLTFQPFQPDGLDAFICAALTSRVPAMPNLRIDRRLVELA